MAQRSRVAFVNAPFAAVYSPSIQLGLLKAECEREGLRVDNVYLNLEFAALIGLPLYDGLNYARGAVAAEWIFTAAAFPEFKRAAFFRRSISDFIERLYGRPLTSWRQLQDIRRVTAIEFVRRVASRLSEYDVVGFTSTFQQNVASLAIARELKRLNPGVVTLFGGSNYEDCMGRAFVEAFEWIDYAISGEADDIIVPLLMEILDHGAASARPGLYGQMVSPPRSEKAIRLTAKLPLAEQPIPNYDEFFETLVRLQPALKLPWSELALPVETARGCWWGAKHHCTFCGLNGGAMTFREKGAQRSAREIAYLVRRHRIKTVNAVDNIITQRQLIPFAEELAKEELGADIFYEVKANLRPAEIRALARGGIRRLQPGIESLSDNVLRLMKKGTTCLQNINMIRSCLRAGVIPSWNLLYGFPGELKEDYAAQFHLLQRLHHLPPPHGYGRIRIDRFSPNFEDLALRSAFGGIRPASVYYYIYPPTLDTSHAAYYFVPNRAAGISDEDFLPLRREIEGWRAQWGEAFALDPFRFDQANIPQLVWDRNVPDNITDTRKSMTPLHLPLGPVQQAVYSAAFDRPVGRRAVSDAFRDQFAEKDIAEAIEWLDTHELIAIVGASILALALEPAGPHPKKHCDGGAVERAAASLSEAAHV